MYKLIIRPFFFMFTPEAVHRFVLKTLKIAFKVGFIRYCFEKFYAVDDDRLKVKLLGMEFKNPVGLAAGFDKVAYHYNDLAVFGFSFIEIGTITPLQQSGNPKPRLFRLVEDEAIINRMGFNNKGITKTIDKIKKEKPRVIIGGNIGKNTATPNDKAVDDYIKCFEGLYDYVDYFVLNVSCPNIADLRDLQQKDSLIEIITSLRKIEKSATPKPMFLKVSPDLSNQQLDEIVEVVNITRIEGVIATNTTTKRDNLKTEKEIVEQLGKGGLSGKPLTNRSTEVIKYLYEKSGKTLNIIGVGGIHTADDAIEKLNAGAKLVQIYTGYIYEGPRIVKKINKGILKKMTI